MVKKMMKVIKKHIASIFIVMCLSIFSAPAVEVANADPNSTDKGAGIIEQVMCNVIDQISGPIGKTIAIIIIISLAIMLFLGKVTWGVAIAVAVGIGILFGAKDLINTLTSSIGDAAADQKVCQGSTKSS